MRPSAHKGPHFYIEITPPVQATLTNRIRHLHGDDCQRVDSNRAQIESGLTQWSKLFERAKSEDAHHLSQRQGSGRNAITNQMEVNRLGTDYEIRNAGLRDKARITRIDTKRVGDIFKNAKAPEQYLLRSTRTLAAVKAEPPLYRSLPQKIFHRNRRWPNSFVNTGSLLKST